MFYETDRRDHGLPHDPFKAIVAPRPIGWVSTLSADGVANLAPYSYFNAVGSRPDMVMFASEGEKDSLRNVRATGEFVCNYVDATLIEAMNRSSIDAPADRSEFALAGLEGAPCRLVRPPRVAAALAALECVATDVRELADRHGRRHGRWLVVGEVVGVHIAEAALRDGRFDVGLARPVTRLGYHDYMQAGAIFELMRPRWSESGND